MKEKLCSKKLEKIYKDSIDWLKFVEAKILAFLTFETGLFYFTVNSNKSFFLLLGKENCFGISLLSILILAIFYSIFLLILGIIPSRNEVSKNPLYFYSWTNNTFEKDMEFDFTVLYKEQISSISKITAKKMLYLKKSIIIYSITIIIIWHLLFL